MIIDRKTAVYFHIDNETDEIIYIGIASEVMGQMNERRSYPRAFDMSVSGRQNDHAEYCKTCLLYTSPSPRDS